MSRSSGSVIDLTEESPPAHSRSVPSSRTSATLFHGWSSDALPQQRSSNPAFADPSPSFGTLSSSSRDRERIFPGALRPAEAIVVGSDDESDSEDRSFTIVGQRRPPRNAIPLGRSLSTGNTASSGRPQASSSSGSLAFLDGIGRGPHGHNSRIPQGVGILGSSSSARHPLLPQQRAAIPSASATTARRTSGMSGSAASFASRLGAGDWPFGGFAFTEMGMIGSLLRGLRSTGAYNGDPPPSTERKVPQQYDVKWTHPHEVQPGFTHSIIEPPVDLDTYFDDKAVVTGPLPDTTPICAGCRHALVTGANEDQRIWVLPCGHVIDGRCVDRLSGIGKVPADEGDDGADSRNKGKAKAVDPPEGEPSAKSAKTGARTRAGAAAAKPPTPKKPKKPKRFECPVQGCGQKCSKEPGGKFSAWPVFV